MEENTLGINWGAEEAREPADELALFCHAHGAWALQGMNNRLHVFRKKSRAAN